MVDWLLMSAGFIAVVGFCIGVGLSFALDVLEFEACETNVILGEIVAALCSYIVSVGWFLGLNPFVVLSFDGFDLNGVLFSISILSLSVSLKYHQ